MQRVAKLKSRRREQSRTFCRGCAAQSTARPLQAAGASAGSFAIGAALPLGVAALVSGRWLAVAVAAISLLCLLGLGAWSAQVAGASPVRGALRVTFWSALAMAVTTGVGALFGSL